MEGTELATKEQTPGAKADQDADQTVLMSGKPLHRFVRKEPRCLGIVILIFGCAELLMGFHLSPEDFFTSNSMFIPFWQGILFSVCGILSIYTELHPSKKMVTVCLAMYVVSLIGIVVSIGYRSHCISFFSYRARYGYYYDDDDDDAHNWRTIRMQQLHSVESVLLTCSLFVFGLLVFLSAVASYALKSTRTQVIVQHVPPPRSDTASN
ncbi:uncharacterized protein KZ484_008315 isoform 1-T2 [Pholidichthys leucotaenia]